MLPLLAQNLGNIEADLLIDSDDTCPKERLAQTSWSDIMIFIEPVAEAGLVDVQLTQWGFL